MVISKLGASPYTDIAIKGVFCEEMCPEPGLKCTKEKFYRKWSNTT